MLNSRWDKFLGHLLSVVTSLALDIHPSQSQENWSAASRGNWAPTLGGARRPWNAYLTLAAGQATMRRGFGHWCALT